MDGRAREPTLVGVAAVLLNHAEGLVPGDRGDFLQATAHLSQDRRCRVSEAVESQAGEAGRLHSLAEVMPEVGAGEGLRMAASSIGAVPQQTRN